MILDSFQRIFNEKIVSIPSLLDRMAANPGMLKGPTMDWSAKEGLYSRYKLWKQQCEILFTGPLIKVEEKIQCKYLLYWSGERGLELVMRKSLLNQKNLQKDK